MRRFQDDDLIEDAFNEMFSMENETILELFKFYCTLYYILSN